MSKKTSFYLYSAAHPDGFMFTETSERRGELESSGEWFDHPNNVPGKERQDDIEGSDQHKGQVRTATNTVLNEQGATGEPRYTLAEILHSSTSMFSIDQLMGEAAKHNVILARNSEGGALEAVSLKPAKPADQPNPPATPSVKRVTSVSYDNEAVAAMVLRGNTEPLRHEHFVALAKLLGIKHHKVKQPDLIVKLKAALEGAQPPQQDGGTGEGDETDDDEVVLGDDGKPVAPLQPNKD